MNLVVGATGLLGSEICCLLAAEGKSARALVRTTSDLIWSSHLRHNPHAAPYFFSFQLFFKFHWTQIAQT